MAGRGKLISVSGDDTVTGFLLGGIGELNKYHPLNILVLEKDMTSNEIKDNFQQFLNWNDIGIIFINQYIEEMVRHAMDAHKLSIPAVLEIPSKEHPYDAAKDSILHMPEACSLLKIFAKGHLISLFPTHATFYY